MRSAGSPDVLLIINGPQDGTEFPIVGQEVRIGQSHECAVDIQLDRNVSGFHGVATATGDGYKIRSASGSPLIVAGKRVGRMNSRLLKPGEVMRVGYTDMLLECSPDGMSRRSKGIKVPTDFGWAIKGVVGGRVPVLDKLGRFISMIPRFAWHNKFLTIILAVMAMKFIPRVDKIVMDIIAQIRAQFK